MNIVDIRPFRPQDEQPLIEAAKEDGHGVFYPTWVLEKNKEIVGYYSVAVPMILCWQHSKKMNAMDSMKELGHMEGSVGGFPMVCLPCDPASPYNRFLPRQGYELYFKPVNLYIKRR
jgi:hypothetical protein